MVGFHGTFRPAFFRDENGGDYIGHYLLKDGIWEYHTVASDASYNDLEVLDLVQSAPDETTLLLQKYDAFSDQLRNDIYEFSGGSWARTFYNSFSGFASDETSPSLLEMQGGDLSFIESHSGAVFGLISDAGGSWSNSDITPSPNAGSGKISNLFERGNGNVAFATLRYVSGAVGWRLNLVQGVGGSWVTTDTGSSTTPSGGLLRDIGLFEDSGGDVAMVRIYRDISGNPSDYYLNHKTGGWAQSAIATGVTTTAEALMDDHFLFAAGGVITRVNTDASTVAIDLGAHVGGSTPNILAMDPITSTATGIAYLQGGSLHYARLEGSSITSTELVVGSGQLEAFTGLDHDADGVPLVGFWKNTGSTPPFAASFATPTMLSVSGPGPVSEGGVATVTISSLVTFGSDVLVGFEVVEGTASAGSDYGMTQGTITIPAGGVSGSVDIPIVADGIGEAPENFFVNLVSATGTALPVETTVEVTIAGLAGAAASLADTAGSEDGGTLLVPVVLSETSTVAVTVGYATGDGTAVAGSDYVATSGTFTFAPGELVGAIPVVVLGDNLLEGDEEFSVTITSLAGAILAGDGVAEVTLYDGEWLSYAGSPPGQQAGYALAGPESDLLVGAPYGNGGTGSAGFLTGPWSESPTLTIPAGVRNNDDFGFEVAQSASWVVVGAPRADDNGARSGSVFVYDRSDITALPELVTGSVAQTGSRFGKALAIEGSTLLVGAHRDDESGTQSGSAFLFSLSPSGASEDLLLVPADGAVGDHFGRAVDMAWPYGLIGAPKDGDNGTDSGSAYLFDLSTGTELVKLLAPNGAPGDSFGRAVAMTSTHAFVGAPDQAGGAGAVHAYDVPSGTYLGTLVPEQSNEEGFGLCLDVLGDFLAVGIPRDDLNEVNDGAVALYSIANATRVATLRHPAPQGGQAFGSSIALGTTMVYAGAPLADSGAGSIIGYPLPAPPPPLPPHPLLPTLEGSPEQGGYRIIFTGRAGVTYQEEQAEEGFSGWLLLDTFTATGWPQERYPGEGGPKGFFRYTVP